MWPIAKSLLKRDGPRAPTAIHGPSGLQFHLSEKAKTIADCLENQFTENDLYRTIWLLLDSIHRLVCGSFTEDHNNSETGSVSVLRWMGQDKPTQLGPS
jgi:hypothetical protein